MTRKIVAIREARGWKSELAKYDFESFDGFEVETTHGVIRLGISSVPDCCEETGYFWSQDDFSSYIGAELLKVDVVDTELNVKKHVDTDAGGTMFVNFTTGRGVLQFVAYNSHNGYYGHTALVESEDMDHRVML